jgi:hypothetical protein
MPDRLRRDARRRVAALSERLIDIAAMPPLEMVDALAAVLLRSDDERDFSTLLAEARGDVIAAEVHEHMLAGKTRGQSIALVMQALSVEARTTVARPLLNAERRHGLPGAGYGHPPAM